MRAAVTAKATGSSDITAPGQDGSPGWSVDDEPAWGVLPESTAGRFRLARSWNPPVRLVTCTENNEGIHDWTAKPGAWMEPPSEMEQKESKQQTVSLSRSQNETLCNPR